MKLKFNFVPHLYMYFRLAFEANYLSSLNIVKIKKKKAVILDNESRLYFWERKIDIYGRFSVFCFEQGRQLLWFPV